MTLTSKGHLPDRVFRSDSEYMLDIITALILAKLLKKSSKIAQSKKKFPPTSQVCFPMFW